MKNKIFVHKVTYNQIEKFTCPFCENAIAEKQQKRNINCRTLNYLSVPVRAILMTKQVKKIATLAKQIFFPAQPV